VRPNDVTDNADQWGRSRDHRQSAVRSRIRDHSTGLHQYRCSSEAVDGEMHFHKHSVRINGQCGQQGISNQEERIPISSTDDYRNTTCQGVICTRRSGILIQFYSVDNKYSYGSL